MAKIKAFSCVRPKEGLEEHIAALPYDVYNRAEAKAEAAKEPYSFLRIDRAETELDDSVDTYDERVYKKAHDLLWKMIEKGDFIQEQTPCYYLYELTMNSRSQTGLVACSSVDDYLEGVIKKHENTRADKEQDRIRHVDMCDAQTGPIFLAYRSNQKLQEMIAGIKQQKKLFSFVSEDGITHQGWRIDEAAKIAGITDAFEKIGSVYIADGHHRAASAVAVGKKRREENPDYSGDEEFNYFLSVLFPGDELSIMDYNRVVKDLNGLTNEAILAAAAKAFDITECATPYSPQQKGCIGMYLAHKWYSLSVKPEFLSDDPVEGLDVSILQRELLAPVLGIHNPKTDSRIDFIGGIRGLKELERRVSEDCAAAFSMYPTAIEELFAVADADLLMPPKSTWFEPKLRSGLFIHLIGK